MTDKYMSRGAIKTYHIRQKKYTFIKVLMEDFFVDPSKCQILRRHYNQNDRIENKTDTSLRDRKDRIRMDIFDRIHCHYQHGYDLFRLTKKEKEQEQKQELMNKTPILRLRNIHHPI